MAKRTYLIHNKIIDALRIYFSPAQADKISRGKQLFFFQDKKVKRVFFITEGVFIIRSQKEKKIINIISAPFVLGALPTNKSSPLYIEKVDYGKIYSVDYSQFWSVINHKNLHTDVMKINSDYHTDLVKCIDLYCASTEDQAINAIRRWVDFPENVKTRFSVHYFLTNSTHLSKSSSSRIIKKLKDAGAIQLEKGKLIKTRRAFLRDTEINSLHA